MLQKISITKMMTNQKQKQYSLSARKEGNIKVVQMHNRYEINSQSPVYEDIEYLLKCLQTKQKNKKRDNLFKVTHYTYFPTFEFLLQKIQPQHQRCCICQFEYETNYDFEKEVTKFSSFDIICTGRCQHLFHQQCMEKYVGDKEFMKCPVCSVIYGVITGDQPDGSMSVSRNKSSLPGYEKCGTIIVQYNMYGGTRNGKNYPPTNRTGYLPDNEAGLRVLRLLEICFQRKLTFTIGRSVTTGADNVIVWNGIHHKTTTHGGSANFGYPDPTYLLRVTEELAAKGIVLE